MSLTISQKLNIAALSESYAANDILKSGLNGGGIDIHLPRKIYCLRKSIAWDYALNPSDTTLTATSNYLIALCGKYYLQANAAINAGGGTVSPVNPTPPSIYPIYITSADFQPDGVSYNNSLIVGANLTLFINEYSQQWLQASSSTFSYTASGIIINIPGFNAGTQSWTILIQKIGS